MRQAAVLVAVMTVGVLAAGGVALAEDVTCPNRNDGSCVGTDSGDTILGSDRADAIKARGGHDLVVASRGDDRVSGGEGGDQLFGGPGRDRLNGGSSPGAAIDSLAGGPGNDLLLESPGEDEYNFEAGWGRDRISGSGDSLADGSQPDFDVLCFACGAGVTEALTIDLSQGTATDGTNSVIWDAPAIERATGGSGADGITGNARDNVVDGSDGPDSINVSGDPTMSDLVYCGGGQDGDGAIDTVRRDPNDSVSTSCTTGDVVTVVP